MTSATQGLISDVERGLRKPRLAVISPFLDKSHGTELHVVEWITYLEDSFEIHIYSQQVKDVDLTKSVLHRIPILPGPHLLNYMWWFLANHLWRAFDRYFKGLRYDLTFSPGINCLDAEVVSVHIVFAEYAGKNRDAVSLARHSVLQWPRILHRKLYYRLIMALERRIYTNRDKTLILIARKTLAELWQFYARSYGCPVLYTGLDPAKFNPQKRLKLRDEARKQIGLSPNCFAVVLVGNDWRNKGVPVLLQAFSQLSDLPVALLLVSRESFEPVRDMATQLGLLDRVFFLPPRKDVEFYYAAADAYAGPSLEDTFALPPAEAMACGLPVIVSSANGTCEIITDGADGLVLKNPRDAFGLSAMIRRLATDKIFSSSLGAKAATTAQRFTWEKNGHQLSALFAEILRRKRYSGGSAHSDGRIA